MVTTISIPANPNNFTPAAPSTFASQPSFSQKVLNFQITLAQGPNSPQPTSFPSLPGASAGGVLNISGFRSRVRITNAARPTASQADIAIWGLDQGIMNQIATLGVINDSVSKNQILISAGAATAPTALAANANAAPPGGFPTVFGGQIWFGYGDYNHMPDVAFRCLAQSGLYQSVKSTQPTSAQGQSSVASLMQGFADALGIPLENNGVTAVLSNPYLPGTIMQQIYAAADHAGINAQIVDGGTKLAIWPTGGSRTSQTNIPLVSPDTGMIGYPTFANNGWLVVKTLYNPDILFGASIRVQSSIPQANKTWTVQHLDLALDSLIPGGEWMMVAICGPQGVAMGVPPAVTP